MVYNCISAITMIICSVFALNVSIVIGFTGAFCGLIIIYILPSFMHLRCVKNKTKYEIFMKKEQEIEV